MKNSFFFFQFFLFICHPKDALKSLKTRSREGRNADASSEELNDKSHNITLPAESRQSDVDDLQFSSKPYYSSKFSLNDVDYYNSPSSNLQQQPPKSFERRNSISAPDFQGNLFVVLFCQHFLSILVVFLSNFIPLPHGWTPYSECSWIHIARLLDQ